MLDDVVQQEVAGRHKQSPCNIVGSEGITLPPSMNNIRKLRYLKLQQCMRAASSFPDEEMDPRSGSSCAKQPAMSQSTR